MKSRFVSGIAAGLLVGGAALAALLVLAQQPFGNGRFEFGTVKSFAGVLESFDEHLLLLSLNPPRRPVVYPGKHGSSESAREFLTHYVEFKGTLIERDGQSMIEAVPDSFLAPTQPVTKAPGPPSLWPPQYFTDQQSSPTPRPVAVRESVSLIGEVVDSKCYLGVMNPGSGKVHRDCAARCISGGIPPAFLVKDRAGRSRILYLVNDPFDLREAVLEFVGEPIRITGHFAGSQSFWSDPRTWKHPE